MIEFFLGLVIGMVLGWILRDLMLDLLYGISSWCQKKIEQLKEK